MKSILQAICLLALLAAAVPMHAAIRIGGTTVTTSNVHYLTYSRYWRVPVGNQNGAVWDSGDPAGLGGKTAAEIQTIVDNHKNTLETDAWFTAIDSEMMADSEVFSFATNTAARQEVGLRKITAQMMGFLNTHRHFWYDQTPPNETTSAFWAYYENGRQYWMFQKRGTKASDAIDSITDTATQSSGECYTAMLICIWWGQRQALGVAGFDAKWPSNGSTNWSHHLVTKYHFDSNAYASKMTRYASGAAGNIHVIGDWDYLKNHNYRDVITDRHLRAMLAHDAWLPWSGENAFYIGTYGGVKKYSGLALDNLSESAMRGLLRDAYNDDLEPIIDRADGKLDTDGDGHGDLKIVELQNIPADNAKISWVSHKRIHN